MYKVYENHKNRLPYVRVSKIELTNFKGVKYGELEFNCLKEDVPYNTKSDIMGIYGQNGSGKSSVVEALSIVRRIISGNKCGELGVRLIDVDEEFAKVNIELEFQYLSGEKAVVSYEVKLSKREVVIDDSDEIDLKKKRRENLCISDEIIKTNIYDDGKIGRMHTIIDTSGNSLLCGDALTKHYYENNSSNLSEISYLKRKTYDDSYSFVFFNDLSDNIINKYNTENHCSKYYEILAELTYFFKHFLFIIGTNTSGIIQTKIGIPIWLPGNNIPFVVSDNTVASRELFEYIKDMFYDVNSVLDKIIPNLSIEIVGEKDFDESGDEVYKVSLFSIHNGKRMPFRFESDGIIKIVSIMADYIIAFNQGSTTMVIDELDSGVYEYLLGQLLRIFEESGKGQLIFTSHDLHPLESINKKFIRFACTDEKNRYVKLKSVGASNNLRDVYLKEIKRPKNSEQKLYEGYKDAVIIEALLQAGENMINENGKR